MQITCFLFEMSVCCCLPQEFLLAYPPSVLWPLQLRDTALSVILWSPGPGRRAPMHTRLSLWLGLFLFFSWLHTQSSPHWSATPNLTTSLHICVAMIGPKTRWSKLGESLNIKHFIKTILILLIGLIIFTCYSNNYRH